MAKEKSVWWMGKTAVVLTIFLSVILCSDGAGILKNKNIYGTDNFLSFSAIGGNCKNFPVGMRKERFCLIACSSDASCKKDQKCVKNAAFHSSLCARKCELDDDCEYPTKCNMTEKYCLWEICDSDDDCKNSLTCSRSPYFRRKLCSRRECKTDVNCADTEICHPKAYACQCANGMSGKKCEVAEWCNENGKFKDCKGVNGTCEYIKSKRAINCICAHGKKPHPDENRCRETCNDAADCKHGGTCEEKGGFKFCSCKSGVFGDYCETVFDCTPDGKYRGCESSGGKCFYDGNKAVCECPSYKKLSDQQSICESKTSVCRGGEIVEEEGKNRCKCPPGYGNFTNYSCRVCDCGPDTNCIWEERFGGNKVCLCKPGYSNKNGKCVACECGPDSTCEWKSEGWLKPDKKVCHCKPGYHDENGKCVGPCSDNPCKNGGTCQDAGNGYVCLCPSECTEKDCTDKDIETSFSRDTTASFMTPTTVKDCYCGRFSYSCSFDLECNKLCSCFSGYFQLDGECVECNCGPYGTCSFKHGRKKCNCRSFTTEINGVCVDTEITSSRGTTGSSTISTILTSTQKDIETTSSRGFTESPTISTILSSTVQDCNCGTFSYSCSLYPVGTKVCSCFWGYSQLSESCAECNCGPYGTCSFEKGRKKCICSSFAKERNGVCVDKQDLQKILQVSIYNIFL